MAILNFRNSNQPTIISTKFPSTGLTYPNNKRVLFCSLPKFMTSPSNFKVRSRHLFHNLHPRFTNIYYFFRSSCVCVIPQFATREQFENKQSICPTYLWARFSHFTIIFALKEKYSSVNRRKVITNTKKLLIQTTKEFLQE